MKCFFIITLLLLLGFTSTVATNLSNQNQYHLQPHKNLKSLRSEHSQSTLSKIHSIEPRSIDKETVEEVRFLDLESHFGRNLEVAPGEPTSSNSKFGYAGSSLEAVPILTSGLVSSYVHRLSSP